MSFTPPPALPTSFSFSQGDFDRIARFARSRFGLNLPLTKKELVYGRVTRRLRATGMNDCSSYLDLVESQHGATEATELLSALTTNVSRFFREEHHFDFLRNKVLPDLVAKARNGGRVRIWSAGCSTGEEPYSIAMSVLKACPEVRDLNFKILATDIDPQVIETGLRGLYPKIATAPIPKDLRAAAFAADDQGGDIVSMSHAVRAMVTFGVLNLLDPRKVSGPFDVIFCRNVAIYMDAQVQSNVWANLIRLLGAGGHIFIGHSERLVGAAQKHVRSVGITAYQKCDTKGAPDELEA